MKLVKAIKPGSCAAMRCKEAATTVVDMNPFCARHAAVASAPPPA